MRGFLCFLIIDLNFFPPGVINSKWWTSIVNGCYNPSSAYEGRILSPIHRFIHRLVTFSINQKKEQDRVCSLDIFFLGSIITPNVFYHFPYCRISDKQDGKNRAGSPIYRGILVTKLARSYGNFNAPKANFLNLVHSRLLQPCLFGNAHIMMDLGGGNCMVPNDDPVEAP